MMHRAQGTSAYGIESVPHLGLTATFPYAQRAFDHTALSSRSEDGLLRTAKMDSLFPPKARQIRKWRKHSFPVDL